VGDLDRALSDIANVRAQLAASTRFRGFAPHAVALTGALALVVAAAQAGWPEELNASPARYVTVWVAVAVVSAAIIASEAIGRARAAHGGMADAMLAGTLRHLMPAGVVGAIVTFTLWRLSPQTLWLLPGLWQLLIALAVFAAQAVLPPPARWVAGWYLATGTASLTVAAGDAGFLSPWLMGMPFLVGQLAFAEMFRRENERSHG
jgi:hypothetical protein